MMRMKNIVALLLIVGSAYAMERPQKHLIRIMTYNIRRDGPEAKEERQWEQRKKFVCALIKRINPAIMGLQEVTGNQLIDILMELGSNFASAGQSRGSSWYGYGADEYNPIIFNKDKVICERRATFSINSSSGYWNPLQVSQTGLLPRICTMGKFIDVKTGKSFYLYNTHLDNYFEEARLAGLAVIKKLSSIAQPDKHLVMITGDFNQEWDNKIKGALPGFWHGLGKARNKLGPHETRTGWEDDEIKQIDHILVNNAQGVAVERYETIEEESGQRSSDHRPVVMEFYFEE